MADPAAQASHSFPFRENKYPYTAMSLMVTGQIVSGQVPDQNGVCCKFDFSHGKDWHLYSGN